MCKNIINAAKMNDIVKVRECIDNGADVNEADRDGFTALHWAARNSNVEICTLLLKNNADVNKADRDGWTALHYAASNGNVEICKLLGNKADVNVTDGWFYCATLGR